ncbi:MAG: dienelactone hydrolase family protein [Deltaproteobacteria bacterium]|jgi:dienelactone hydrolase|nr:dienelactone hydrolase family protein [Deltaproteobacteria bacterium]
MKVYPLVILILFFTLAPPVFSGEWVTFKGTCTTIDGTGFRLKAKLSKPAGAGPFPAVIMMHCCAGDTPSLDPWEEGLVNWGYVVLRLDSLTPRKMKTFCGDPYIDSLVKNRCQDACDAKSYLMRLAYVDKEKIGIIGWADGGMAAISAIRDATRPKNLSSPFKAAIALYPRCDPVHDLNAPLLVMIGRDDDWYPAERCKKYLIPGNAPYEITLKIYDNTAHGFDWENINIRYLGHTLKYNPGATQDAMSQAKKFLSKHLK